MKVIVIPLFAERLLVSQASPTNSDLVDISFGLKVNIGLPSDASVITTSPFWNQFSLLEFISIHCSAHVGSYDKDKLKKVRIKIANANMFLNFALNK